MSVNVVAAVVDLLESIRLVVLSDDSVRAGTDDTATEESTPENVLVVCAWFVDASIVGSDATLDNKVSDVEPEGITGTGALEV